MKHHPHTIRQLATQPNPRTSLPFLKLTHPGSFLLGLASIAVLLASCGKQPDAVSNATPSAATNAATTNAPAAAANVPAEFTKLIGKWERPDGGYVLEIKSAQANGMLSAAYYNPNSINVSRAAALRENNATKVFVELRDVNYPGSTYSLTYDPKTDQLYGQYFQATLQQTFEVTFGRLK